MDVKKICSRIQLCNSKQCLRRGKKSNNYGINYCNNEATNLSINDWEYCVILWRVTNFDYIILASHRLS